MGLTSRKPSFMFANVPGEFFPGQRLDGHDGAVLHELLFGSFERYLLQADAAKNLDGSLAHLRRARVDGRSMVMLHGQRAHAVARQQQRGR